MKVFGIIMLVLVGMWIGLYLASQLEEWILRRIVGKKKKEDVKHPDELALEDVDKAIEDAIENSKKMIKEGEEIMERVKKDMGKIRVNERGNKIEE